ncbi:ATP-dependent DNA ligase [Mycetocola manganoxydans]|uniref:ATP-dependent DNA ligase n=1 Tax=Mycetocola manganoxydans TaxID=699879 RepID=A0A3L6ZX59_9MICO|nr:ATP-dependent DNA ligase [Mycetocola manganoxydans]RLP72497.1 ATP-dependent DNA ligase [Mycetocola manganoxydans]GHD40006.1 hypothetical protein GCM10008097_03640 [Mycetocola manganoxydans]
MAKLLYGIPAVEIDTTDRELAHLKVVIVTKLRRGEVFTLAVNGRINDAGPGRRILWVHPSIPIQFQFDGTAEEKLNREWLEELMAAVNAGGNLQITPEPAAHG